MKWGELIKELGGNKLFYTLIFLIFFLHLLTYPSIHHIGDEQNYLDIGKEICQGNFSRYTGEGVASYHTPLYPLSLCLTSFLHNFNLEAAELVTFGFLISMIICWYFSIPKDFDRKRFILLLFANNLLWIYSLRVLMDIPLAFFLSLGMLHLYLFFERKKKTNYYLGCLFLSLAIMVRENALIYLPIFFFYILVKRPKDIKKVYLLLLPLIPYLLFIGYQVSTGYDIFQIFILMFKATTPTDFSFIPYADLPVFLYMAGAFGIGILSLIFALKNLKKTKVNFRNFIIFFLVMYLVWEIVYDFVAFASIPRYHLTIIPFLTLIITEGAEIDKKMKYFYYLTLVYVLITGFLMAYYFHSETVEIWKLVGIFK